ncbi:MAG: glycosyltransferase [Bacteroidia bacterium]|nr:glycosyltransferase [Bacteroidia bacterium]
MNITLIVPVFNESHTIADLINTIRDQSLLPAEIILVDGGSTDNTVQLAREFAINEPRFHIIEAGRAMPGKGRNIGSRSATTEWIAFTDAGIKLDKYWLENLVKKAEENPALDIIYGNFSPQLNSFFDKCATLAYVPALRLGKIRTKSVASLLLKREAWEKTGGFPDWRAAEDLIFFERAEQLNYHFDFAPDAMAYWQLRPDLKTTYQKFELYSKYNVWAGRQAFWHYGIARQYAVIMLAILLSIIHKWYWILLLPVWVTARVAKRIISHRHEFGIRPLFNPAVFSLIVIITLIIDAATFIGWIKGIVKKRGQLQSAIV